MPNGMCQLLFCGRAISGPHIRVLGRTHFSCALGLLRSGQANRMTGFKKRKGKI